MMIMGCSKCIFSSIIKELGKLKTNNQHTTFPIIHTWKIWQQCKKIDNCDSIILIWVANMSSSSHNLNVNAYSPIHCKDNAERGLIIYWTHSWQDMPKTHLRAPLGLPPMCLTQVSNFTWLWCEGVECLKGKATLRLLSIVHLFKFDHTNYVGALTFQTYQTQTVTTTTG